MRFGVSSIIQNLKSTRVRDVIAKSLEKHRLTMEETAVLINSVGTDLVMRLKREQGT